VREKANYYPGKWNTTEHSIECKKSNLIDIFVCLVAISVLPAFYYGLRILEIYFVATIAALVTDFLYHKFVLRCLHFRIDPYSIVTALIIGGMMPASVPYYIVIVAVCFALIIGKYPFGGNGRTAFNPACVGVAFVVLAFKTEFEKFPRLLGHLTNPESFWIKDLVYSPEHYLRNGGVGNIEHLDALTGKFASPIMFAPLVVIGACGLYLLFRKTINWRLPIFYLATIAACAVIFPRVSSGPLSSMYNELMAGGVLFAGIILAGDFATTPKTNGGKKFFGILFGIMTVIIRGIGGGDYSVVFALIIANALARWCDVFYRPIINHTFIALWNLIKRCVGAIIDFYNKRIKNDK
jgi:Predicted NADH:ubiquinone oxidoreductase, subunit RnfD